MNLNLSFQEIFRITKPTAMVRPVVEENVTEEEEEMVSDKEEEKR